MIGALAFTSAAEPRAGDRVEWDTDEPASLQLCEALWQEASCWGFAFYGNGRRLPERVIRAGFDPATVPRETVIVAPAIARA